MPFGFADNVSMEEEQRYTSQAKGSREKNHRKGILGVMTEKRGCVRGQSQEQQMHKVNPERHLVAFFEGFKNPVAPHPKKSHHAKACQICQEIWDLLDQLGDKLCLTQPLSLRDLEIENQERDNDCVNTVSECAESFSGGIFTKKETFSQIAH